MLVIGLDAAAQWKKFGYAIGHYADRRISIESAGIIGDASGLERKIGSRLRSSNDALLAIDAPLGWPKALGQVLAQHSAGDPLEPMPNELFRRVTDDYVHALIRKRPLDVGADKIARAAWRALDVLNLLRHMVGNDIPVLVEPWGRSGVAAIEVYPAATLIVHKIKASGYKDREGLDARRAIAKELEPTVAGITPYAEEADDVFDACLCLLAGLDFLENDALPPVDLGSARKEGWIWVRHP